MVISESEHELISQVTGIHPLFAEAARKLYTMESTAETSDPARKIRWTAAELLQAEFPPTVWAVPGILPQGLTILAGRPKVGKSWLALQIAHAVGMGGQVLGHQVEQGAVLYLALEDGPKRLQKRLELQGVPEEAAITFVTEWHPLSNGGMKELEAELSQKEYRLVVVDTFSRASGGRDDQQDMQEMTCIMGPLQKTALSHNLALLLVDHHKKPSVVASNPIDDILGSTGKAAVADCALGLYRERGKPGAILRITGRDMPEADMALSWDGTTCCWQYEGEAGQVREDSERGRVLNAIRLLSEDGELPTPTTIAEVTGMDKQNVSRTLQYLVTDGLVIREKKVGAKQPYSLVPADNEE